MKNYFKRLIKYVLFDYKQPIVKAEIVESSINGCHKNKKYIITGGSSGLGLEIARSLIRSGAQVIITGRNEMKLEEAQKSLGENCEYYAIDVSDVKANDVFMKNMFEKHKKIDGIINNAGISLHEKDFLDVTERTFFQQFDINLKGAYFLTQSYIKNYMKYNQKKGNVIFVSSERGSMCDELPYGLTKVSINSLTQALSSRYYQCGIRVNAIGPGVTCSELTKIKKDDDLFAEKSSGRVFLPEEMANIVNFLLSDYSSAISGEIINCDAGNHIRSYFMKF